MLERQAVIHTGGPAVLGLAIAPDGLLYITTMWGVDCWQFGDPPKRVGGWPMLLGCSGIGLSDDLLWVCAGWSLLGLDRHSGKKVHSIGFGSRFSWCTMLDQSTCGDIAVVDRNGRWAIVEPVGALKTVEYRPKRTPKAISFWGRWLAITPHQGACYVVDTQTHKPAYWYFRRPWEVPTAVKHRQDGYLAIGFQDGNARIFLPPEHEKGVSAYCAATKPLVKPAYLWTGFAVSALEWQGDRLWGGLDCGSLVYWEPFRTDEMLASWAIHQRRITTIKIYGDKLITGSLDGEVMIFQIDNEQKTPAA